MTSTFMNIRLKSIRHYTYVLLFLTIYSVLKL